MKTAIFLCFVSVTIFWSAYAGKVKTPELEQEPEILGSSEHLKKTGDELKADKNSARLLIDGGSMTGVSSRSTDAYVLKVHFQEELRKVQVELREASQQIRHLTSNLQLTNTKFEQAHKEVQILRKNLADAKKKPAHLSTGYPAFSAYASTGGVYEIGEFVMFQQVLYNSGTGYNVETGSYTCFVHGVYLFSVNVRLYVEPDDNMGDLSLVQNTVRVASLKWQAQHGGYEWNHVSTTVVLECNAGDVLRVQAFEQSYVSVSSDSNDNHYSSFSGTLLAILWDV